MSFIDHEYKRETVFSLLFNCAQIVLKIKNHTETFLLNQSKIFISLPLNFFTINQELRNNS